MGKSFANAQVTAIGWDTTTEGEQSSELQNITSTVLDDSSCKAAYPNETPSQFCTKSAQGESTCKLGSSGAVFYTDSVTSKDQDTLFIIGMLIKGSCPGPILNTKVTELLNWIVSQTPGVNYCRK